MTETRGTPSFRFRGPARRPRSTIHLFEILAVAHLLALHALLHAHGLGLRLAAIPSTLVSALALLVPAFLIGVALRLAYSAMVGEAEAYWRRIRDRSWILLSVRLLVSTALVIYFYSSLKGLLQILHGATHDQALWRIDQWTLLGFSPNVLSLYAFQNPFALKIIDAGYSTVFVTSLAASIPFFFSLESDRLRLAYATGGSMLWLAGAWLYYLVPSLGPCYAFAEVWEPFAAALPQTLQMQRFLMANYQAIGRIAVDSIPPAMNILGGIAAFPSLHVASQAFIVLWIARLIPGLRLPAYLSLILIFVGSVVTGWHYLVDSLAGLVLAWVSYRLSLSFYGLNRRWTSQEKA